MRCMVVYESMFGATRKVAEAIARGVRDASADDVEVSVRRVAEADSTDVRGVDVLLVGAPTHAHSLSRPASRAEAVKWAAGEKPGLVLEPDAERRGVRDFLDDLSAASVRFVAFGTRAEGPEVFTGSSARAIGRRLKRKGFVPLVAEQAFLVDAHSALIDGEERRAEQLGRALAAAVAPESSRPAVHEG